MADTEQNAGATPAPAPRVETPVAAPTPAAALKPAAPETVAAKPATVKPAAAKPRAKAPAKAKAVRTAAKTVKSPAKAAAAKPAVKAPAAKIKVAKPKTNAVKAAGAKPATVKPAAPKPAASPDRIAELKHAAQSAATQFKDKTMTQTTTLFTDYADFAKGNLEAVVASGKILFAGLQTFGASMAADSKAAVETFKTDAKDLAAARTPTDFVQLQNDMMRRNWDTAVACASKNGAAVVKLANDAIEPIADRVNLAVDRVRKAA